MCSLCGLYLCALAQAVFEKQIVFIVHISSVRMPYEPHRLFAVYPVLHLAVHLTLVGALREGEIVGLTPEDLDFDAADGIGTFRINKSMQRVRKEALNQVDDGCIIKVFPDKLERSTTSLILKSTKTASSCRTIFMTSALKEELKKWLNQLAADERKDPTRYRDSGMLFRLPNGLAAM